MITKKAIKAEYDYYLNEHREYVKKLDAFSEGNIFFKSEHRQPRPYVYINGKEIYLPKKKQSLIDELVEKKKVSESIIQIKKNLKLLEEMEAGYTEYGDIKIFQKTGAQTDVIKRWLNMPRNKNRYKEHNRIHVTPAGERVRSKEELIIAILLENAGIVYKYEEGLMLDGNEVYPDFTIKRKRDGKIVIWEHYGMMDVEEYRISNRQKAFLYEECGYRPYDNFIATYSNGEDGVDIVLLKQIIEFMLI
ncbi:MAG: hypothetical protein GX663_10245 [Clostridiales bacterium]|nr:hypothetical protein [Clostridiales bacterium]